jgi:hypothetical protein
MTTPYHFYFIVVPRRTSNSREVRFGEVAVLKQISVLHHKNLWKFSEYLFDLKFLVHMNQVISKLSLFLHFSIWATEGPQTNRPLLAVLFWQISVTIYICLSIAFFLSSFDHGTFEEVATVVYALYVVILSWNLNQKGLIYYYAYANIANRIMWSFVWRKFSSVRIREWWDEIKNGQKLKLGDAYVTPKNIQDVQASKLWDTPEAPLLHRQKSSHLSRHYIFIAPYSMCFSWSVSCFRFQFYFVLFAAINGLITSCCFGERLIPFFICQEHSSFHSYRSMSVLFFSNCV